MKYIIDTDILIYFFKNDQKIVEKFSQISPKNITTTIINYTELLFGAYNSLKVEENLNKFQSFLRTIKILDFNKSAAEKFAQLKTRLKQEGNLIADMDLMIASICICNKSVLITNNTKHFSRIEELTFENWR
jgi:predicted nucleic acid-binding protein